MKEFLDYAHKATRQGIRLAREASEAVDQARYLDQVEPEDATLLDRRIALAELKLRNANGALAVAVNAMHEARAYRKT